METRNKFTLITTIQLLHQEIITYFRLSSFIQWRVLLSNHFSVYEQNAHQKLPESFFVVFWTCFGEIVFFYIHCNTLNNKGEGEEYSCNSGFPLFSISVFWCCIFVKHKRGYLTCSLNSYIILDVVQFLKHSGDFHVITCLHCVLYCNNVL